MNKFFKRISLVGLLISTSCGYSEEGTQMGGIGVSAGINENGAVVTLSGPQTCSHDYTVGDFPVGYCDFNQDVNTISKDYNYDEEKNAWSADGTNFNIVAVDKKIYKFGTGSNSNKIYKVGDDTIVLYHKTEDNWYKGDNTATETDENKVTVLDLTSTGSDNVKYEIKASENNALKLTLTRDANNYTWPSPLSPAQFNFAGQTVTLNCQKVDDTDKQSTFMVTQFGEVSCINPKGVSTLVLAPDNDVENVLLLEPGSRVGSHDSILTVEKGIIDLSKYLTSNTALARGEKIYLNLTGGDTQKIKLFGEYEMGVNFNEYTETPAFKNIKLGDNTPLFTQISPLNFSTLEKLFTLEGEHVDEKIIEQFFNDKVSGGALSIDVDELVGKNGNVIVTPNMLTKLSSDSTVQLTNNHENAKDTTLDFSGVTVKIDDKIKPITNITLSNIVDGDFGDGKITLTGLPTSEVEIINVDAGENVALELKDGNVITELIVPDGKTVSVYGTGTIKMTEVSPLAKLIFMPGSNIKLGDAANAG